MSARLTKCFEVLKEQKRSAFIPFIMGGDPNHATSQAILNALPEAGADIIELGIPFSDPMADGKPIQAAGIRALSGGASLKTVLAQVQAFRTKNSTTPLVLMGYANPIFHFGYTAFAAAAHDAGVDGLIVVDIPPEEAAPLEAALKAHGIALVRLIAPTSIPSRLPLLTAHASGYLYLVSIAGITGAAAATQATIEGYMREIRAVTNLPVAVGFGIKTAAQVRELQSIADGVIVGSAIVEKIGALRGDDISPVIDFVRSLRE
jgi:tryptophan synthase alpha chain